MYTASDFVITIASFLTISSLQTTRTQDIISGQIVRVFLNLLAHWPNERFDFLYRIHNDDVLLQFNQRKKLSNAKKKTKSASIIEDDG
jgi:hypothetical protein